MVEEITSLISAWGISPLAGLALVAAATLAVAWLVQVVVIAALRRIARSTATNFDDEIINALSRPLFWSVVTIGLVLTFLLLSLPEKAAFVAVASGKTVLVVLWMRFAIELTHIVLGRLSKLADRAHLVKPQTLPLFENLTVIIFVAFAVYAVFIIWGINMTAWLASAGVVGIAVGFAAKDTLANLFSGVFILTDAPYKVGDYIVLDSGERGKVTHIGIRSTRMLTRDDVEVTIPNAVMGNAKIVNESGGPYTKYRLRVDLSVAYGTDIDRLEEILLDIAAKEKLVCEEPAPRMRFHTFGDSGLGIALLCWIEHPELRGKTRHFLNRAIYKRLAQEGIEIPYPKRDLYIKENPR
ncbi:MAG TPA: mechanosensitive ion channel family protein [Candidatus Moranbacteria bacterium]|nr:mechanosensitive ion channel family protein [Candidatus Moranbacteria bacterium]